MKATHDILTIWHKFNEFPMETITKAWYSRIAQGPKQRTVEQMISHRAQYGTSGNCFDLAIWLLHEFRKEKVTSYAIVTPDSHVAVIALNDQGKRYLCDLGDQWMEPILIDRDSEDYSHEYLDNFFPGAQVRLESLANHLQVTYRRPNGKEMHQAYLLDPITDDTLRALGEQTQRALRSPLVEKRIYTNDAVIHWEFDNYSSFYSTMEGKRFESSLNTVEQWAERISLISGIHSKVILDGLEVYSKL